MEQLPTDYPAALEIDYPELPRDWFTVLLRPVLIIPIAIVLALVSGPGVHARTETWTVAAGGVLFCATALMVVFRQKYPGWWFDWNVALTAFGLRVMAYLALLRDEYPSTDEEQSVHLAIGYPDARADLNRWLPLVKWLLAVPHYIVLGVLAVAAVVCVIIAWFAILVSGQYPRPLFDFVVGVLRWWVRVAAYAILLTTDRYPPFRLGP
ncbi:MAG TPA: DUF4389 domain-containing protein [Gemmatimonadales bacterium]|jgi:hypothetical protein|nr:DUF4389 domain-containing protein [Gemmatimonadales bacterium]